MNIRKIILEEINDFDWTDVVDAPEFEEGDWVLVAHPSGQGRQPYIGQVVKVYKPSEKDATIYNKNYKIQLWVNGRDAGGYHTNGDDLTKVSYDSVKRYL